ncbi:MAG: YbcC family protein [Acidiferrobacter sp.]
MMAITNIDKDLKARIDMACGRIAPLWPLKSFVAVNPYFGLADQPFWQADVTLKRVAGQGLTMPRAFYKKRIESGRITRADMAAALRETGSSWDVATLEEAVARPSQAPAVPLALVTDILGELDRQEWPGFVLERISQYCAAYFDEGQALWAMPWRGQGLYAGWRAFTRLDRNPRTVGLRGMRAALDDLPDQASRAIGWALRQLAVPEAATDDYLHAALLSVGGWAGWARYKRWQAELAGGQDDTIQDLLAIRVCWDALLYKLRFSERLKSRWYQSMVTDGSIAAKAAAHPQAVAKETDALLQTAFEIAYQRELVGALKAVPAIAPPKARAPVQAVFCIDVRSEIFRRAFETVAPAARTGGFAGFFGVLMEYLPLGASAAKGHLPILFNPSYRICEHVPGANPEQTRALVAKRHGRLRAADAWKTFKTSASSCFTFVEAAGLLYAPKMFGDSMGWTRAVSHPDAKGLDDSAREQLGPRLASDQSQAGGAVSGIPAADRPGAAEFALRNMGMTSDFARLVVLIGHGSTTVNNPQATALDCGACAGQTGEASARIAVALLNDPVTRKGLVEKGIDIPADTVFIAGLHDTTTDDVALFDTAAVPSSHAGDLRQLREWLKAAGQVTRMERSAFLGMGGLPEARVGADIKRRTRDWAEVRPEWALANNAAFIAAPRARTARCDLGGRAFLHDYAWRNDSEFKTLNLIMSAPMVVGNWINMQYYGSVVDNVRFGSGNKVLHNVVGGSIGVLEGNGGDLRVGLAMQSLHDGHRWMHEPMRLNVFIEAPQAAMDDVIAGNPLVRQLVENAWLHLFQIDDEGRIHRRGLDRQWREVLSAEGAHP